MTVAFKIFETVVKSFFIYQVLKTTESSVLDGMDYCCYSASGDISICNVFDYLTA